jgi:hypothetical protein
MYIYHLISASLRNVRVWARTRTALYLCGVKISKAMVMSYRWILLL